MYYMSNGCAGQYKNCKNFLNLCHHFQDFGVHAEWHFFAMAHGKLPCDSAGGTLKWIVTEACLQHLYKNQNLTAHQLFLFAMSNIKGMHFCFAEMVEHKEESTEMTSMLVRASYQRHSHSMTVLDIVRGYPTHFFAENLMSQSCSQSRDHIIHTHLLIILVNYRSIQFSTSTLLEGENAES